MQCPHCGADINDHDVFCPTCNEYVLPIQGCTESSAEPEASAPVADPAAEAPAPASEPAISPAPEPDIPAKKRKFTLPRFPLRSSDASPIGGSHSAPAQKGRKPGIRKQAVLMVILCVITLAAVGAAGYVLYSTSSMRVELNKARTEKASAEATVSTLAAQVDELEATLSEVQAANRDLTAQVDQLSSQVSGLENAANQNTYDLETMERKLTEAESKNDTLSASVEDLTTQLDEASSALSDAESENDQLQSENTALASENASLGEQVTAMTTQLDFYNAHVVFVMLDEPTKLYHRYSCPNFTKANYFAYNLSLAKYNGYSPCPDCFGE